MLDFYGIKKMDLGWPLAHLHTNVKTHHLRSKTKRIKAYLRIIEFRLHTTKQHQMLGGEDLVEMSNNYIKGALCKRKQAN